jgi:hypothetical protein
LIRATIVIGKNTLPEYYENFSGVWTLLRETNPDLDLGLNLTVKTSILEEDDLNETAILVVGMPLVTTIPNTTVLRGFLARGGSLLLMSNYNGGDATKSSEVLNGILKETYINNVSFGGDAISVSNSSQKWQEKVYQNNSLAVRVNSTMFNLSAESASTTSDVTQVVTMSCSLNVTSNSVPFAVGNATVSSDSGLSNWLLLFDNGTNRIILSGSASMFNNTYLDVESNRFLFRNMILWLVERFQMPSPDVFAPVILISSAVLACGILVYVLSKKRRI